MYENQGLTHDCDCHCRSRNGDSNLGGATVADGLDVILATPRALNRTGRFPGRNRVHSDDRGRCDEIALRGSWTHGRLRRHGRISRSEFVG